MEDNVAQHLVERDIHVMNYVRRNAVSLAEALKCVDNLADFLRAAYNLKVYENHRIGSRAPDVGRFLATPGDDGGSGPVRLAVGISGHQVETAQIGIKERWVTRSLY